MAQKSKAKKHAKPQRVKPGKPVSGDRCPALPALDGDRPTPHARDKAHLPDRQVKAKPSVVSHKVPVASPRPEALACESTSGTGHATFQAPVASRLSPKDAGPTALPPASGPLSAFGQRQVMWFHHPDNYHVMGVVWAEHENLTRPSNAVHPELGNKGTVRIVKCYHILHREPNSGGVAHHKARPQDQPHLSPISATTTVAQFEEYLRGCLRQFGGPREAWGLLGVEAPRVEAQAAPESAPSHAEMYERAARLLDTTVDALRAKYGHLNPGLQQMNLRNRLRAKGHNV